MLCNNYHFAVGADEVLTVPEVDNVPAFGAGKSPTARRRVTVARITAKENFSLRAGQQHAHILGRPRPVPGLYGFRRLLLPLLFYLFHRSADRPRPLLRSFTVDTGQGWC